MSGGHDDNVGRAYLETQQALGQICDENRPILALYPPFPASVSFRLLPPSCVGIRFGSLLARVSDGNMSGCHDDYVGRAYLGTQQAMGQICGENRPILVAFLPFSCFRQLPSASAVSFRFGSHLVCVADVNMSGGHDDDVGGGISGYSAGPGPNLWRKSTDSSSASSIFLIPSASVGFRHLPSASVSGRFWSVCLTATFLRAMMTSGEHIWEPNIPWPNSRENRPILALFLPFCCFRQLQSDAAISRQLPFRAASGSRG